MIRLLPLVISVLLVCFCAADGYADIPDLEAGAYIYDGVFPLEVDRHSAPDVADWNNDGKKDLIVGQFGRGYIWLYLNQGTDEQPVFKGGTRIESNGSPITTSYG